MRLDVFTEMREVRLVWAFKTFFALSALVRVKGQAPALWVGDPAYQADMLMKNLIPDTGEKEDPLQPTTRRVAAELFRYAFLNRHHE